ncbi:MAG TPA: hypothetical protein VF310_04060, partial [Vicinamibacteria bacterium]
MRAARRLAWAPLLLVTTACFQGQRVIKVNADGSGTIEDTLILGEQLKGLAAMADKKDEDPKAKMKAAAAAMGPGVTLVSEEKTKDGNLKAVFAFKDISQIKVEMSPGPDGGEQKSTQKPLTFRFARQGPQSVLTVVQPQPASQADAPKAPEGMEAMAQGMWGMMKAMAKGLKLTTVVEVNGRLVKSSSPHADPKTARVTLFDIDFDQVTADEANFKKFTKAGSDPDNMDPKLLQGVKGV